MEICCLVRILEPPRHMAEADMPRPGRHTDTATQNKARARQTEKENHLSPGSQEAGPGLSGCRERGP